MLKLRDRILAAERTARLLEPDSVERSAARSAVVEHAEEFLDTIYDRRAFTLSPNAGSGLLDSPISESGIPIADALELIADNVESGGINPASGGHLGYIPGGGIYLSALGDYLADVFNWYAGVFYAGPGAVRMENMLVRWMCSLVGYPSGSHGNLTSSGSLANLIAIITARDAKNIRSRDVERAVIYLSEQTHHSIDKAIRVAGLGDCVIRYLPLDERFRIKAGALTEQVKADKDQGLLPFCVVASAGTTDVGAIDPLPEIGAIAREHGLWYHIDAAYGGFFILTAEGKDRLRGIELSDSVIMDPHKGLFMPYGLGVVLVRNVDDLKRSFGYNANYMQDAVAEIDELSPADTSPELTKHFRGLRFWLPLKLHGVAPFRACLDEKLLLAKYFCEEIKKLGFETVVEPELSVVAYRWVPKEGDADEFNQALLAHVVSDGRVFISSTMLNGRFTLRFACLSFRTHLATVDTLISLLSDFVKGK
ncbi:MAG: aminotransferase class V-fold PLP-dependent enzyme [Acidobacteria bacterium]|nr:aminotransferase class V-fold PLP-dependent enzyme [Acidobacteriota bacterium]